MTVKELIDNLEDMDPDLEVIIASDSEGNNFHPLYDLGRYIWNADYEEITDDSDISECNCVVLWPGE